jgi:uncharacterized protein (TIGR02265 family)
MARTSSALELVAPHCDIVERLELVPPSACVRGVYFRNVEAHLERAGRLGVYREIFGAERHSALPYYPLSDYLLRIAVAGALVESPERLHQGMFAIARGNAVAFAQSLLGRALFRLLARDPVRLSEQGLAARRQSNTYGHWAMQRHGPNEIEMLYTDEYQWIDSIIAGAAQGTFDACGVNPTLETRMKSRFNGSTLIRW